MFWTACPSLIWNGGNHRPIGNLVKWSWTALPIQQGGLGVGSLDKRNTALLMKWLWRFATEKNSLWRKVIAAIYGEEPVRVLLGILVC